MLKDLPFNDRAKICIELITPPASDFEPMQSSAQRRHMCVIITEAGACATKSVQSLSVIEVDGLSPKISFGQYATHEKLITSLTATVPDSVAVVEVVAVCRIVSDAVVRSLATQTQPLVAVWPNVITGLHDVCWAVNVPAHAPPV